MVKDYLAKIAICNVCGKEKTIVLQRNRVKGKDGQVDIYLECEDCVRMSPSP
jgi:hypothetical protein